LVHLGSGCIYEGDQGGRGFIEEDTPNFHGSFYSRTKAWIDQILKEFPVLVLRLRMPFDATWSERSLISKLVKYPRVIDVPNSLTYLPDLMHAAVVLIQRRATGLYNVVNPGALSAYEIMHLYREIVDPRHVFRLLPLDELPGVTKAGRSNCILSTEKLEREGIRLPPVRVSLTRALKALAAIKKAV